MDRPQADAPWDHDAARLLELLKLRDGVTLKAMREDGIGSPGQEIYMLQLAGYQIERAHSLPDGAGVVIYRLRAEEPSDGQPATAHRDPGERGDGQRATVHRNAEERGDARRRHDAAVPDGAAQSDEDEYFLGSSSPLRSRSVRSRGSH